MRDRRLVLDREVVTQNLGSAQNVGEGGTAAICAWALRMLEGISQNVVSNLISDAISDSAQNSCASCTCPPAPTGTCQTCAGQVSCAQGCTGPAYC